MRNRFLQLMLAAAAASGLIGCDQAAEPPSQQADVEQPTSFTGTLGYRARIALPPQAEIILTIRDVNSATTVAEHRFTLGERQVPIAFDWSVDPARMSAGGPHEFTASIALDGEPRWVSSPLQVTPSAPALGEILLLPRAATHRGLTFACGDTVVRFVPGDGDLADMHIANSAYAMQEVVAASGAKYENPGQPGTVFWSKGDSAFVSVNGASLPECHKTDAADGAQTAPSSGPGGGVRQTLWRLEKLNGSDIVDPSRITLQLDDMGRVSGSGGCNHYTGSYTLDGESLSISQQIAATMKACAADSVMAQEGKFFELLPAMTTASIDATGVLILSGPQEQRLLFRREEVASQTAE